MLETINSGASEKFHKKEEPTDDLPPTLQDSIKKIIESKGYITYKLKAKNFDSNGGNFLGQCFMIDVKGKTAGGAKETNIFIKQIVTFNKIQFFAIEEAFQKEVFVYKDLSKVIESLQEQAGVPPEDRYKIPKAYDQTDNKAIILDNLSKSNFKTYNRLDVMPLKYVQLSLQALAKFHGLSFVIENKIPEYFNKKIEPLRHAFRYDEDWKGLVKNVYSCIANLYDDNIKTKIENLLPRFLEKFPIYNSRSENVRYCLIHGDYRTNNVLAREHNGEAVEVMPIDYQTIEYGCPIKDFLFFVFSGTDREFRQKHLNDLKELYFNTMSRFLIHFDVDIETVYPREEFERVYTEWLDYGLMMVLYGSGFLYGPETTVNMEDITLSELPYSPDKNAQERLKGIIDEFIQWGYL